MEENMQNEDMEMNKKSGSNAWIIVVIVLALGGGFWYVNKGKNDMLPESLESSKMEQSEGTSLTASPTSMAPTDTNTTADTSMMTEEGVKTFDIKAGSFFFSPNVLEVKKGDKVKIILTTEDELKMHDFTLDEFNVKSDRVKKGQPVTVEFTADKVGDFEFYCSVMDHRAKGQVGTLKVTQ